MLLSNQQMTDMLKKKKKDAYERSRGMRFQGVMGKLFLYIYIINVAKIQIRKILMKSSVFKKLFAQSDGSVLHTRRLNWVI